MKLVGFLSRLSPLTNINRHLCVPRMKRFVPRMKRFFFIRYPTDDFDFDKFYDSLGAQGVFY